MYAGRGSYVHGCVTSSCSPKYSIEIYALITLSNFREEFLEQITLKQYLDNIFYPTLRTRYNETKYADLAALLPNINDLPSFPCWYNINDNISLETRHTSKYLHFFTTYAA